LNELKTSFISYISVDLGIQIKLFKSHEKVFAKFVKKENLFAKPKKRFSDNVGACRLLCF